MVCQANVKLITAVSSSNAGRNNANRPTEVRIAGCTVSPCTITQGTTANMQIDFRSLNAASSLRPVVNAQVGASWVSYPLQPQFHNACSHLVRGSCPLAAQEQATYNFAFSVTPVYPPIRVNVELSLLDQAGRHVICTVIPVQVRTR